MQKVQARPTSMCKKHHSLCPELALIEAACHSIVGKGNHSANHIQKLKPKVKDLCRQMGEELLCLVQVWPRLILVGLQFSTEHNAVR